MTTESTYDNSALSHEDEGYHKALKPRQIQMIAIGGAIGTGLFMGAGSRLNSAGPGLFLVYAVCGIFVFFILRALGELVLHRPSSGSFVSYAREFFGEKTAFVTGWLYFFNWAATAIVDVTAVALYMHYWGMFEAVPQWLIALIALGIVLTMNIISVKLFGEMEFWASIIKVAALVTFLIVGIVFLAGRFEINGQATGLGVIADNGGLLPVGIFPLVVVTSGVIFAYAAVELVGIAAGETADPPKVMPRAINSVIVRIALFYVGSLVLLALLLPYTEFHKGESPFVTFFSKIGVPAAGGIMNLVVLTAAMSSLNAGLYSTGRILRSMAMNGSGPAFTAKMNRNGVPFGGIALTGALTLLGVVLNLFVPEDAFNIALDLSALGIISTWAMIVACQLQLYRWERKGILQRPKFRLPGTPYTGYATLVFLAAVTILMCYENVWNLIAIIVLIPMLVGGWYAVRGKVTAMAAQRMGYTGDYPVIPQPPVPEGPGEHRD
ncbi:amino acid permease-associated protein [Mycolicibacterium canariasense]|uniref:Amino acid permease-associated protein n=1 Tax=Mycolicibacterium canariasense TaxID=228230 RepID=A0A100WK04_MYCCR|nr:amino acid permease [Mycolicibacterium canariasense]MCV7207165.1 amino acid permease [Mycolicibacterium canariasense]ORV06594.1 L-asparagine permease [Mycolicibacterium canariasense]GAS99581.1 amino acid permease-associated protein [Mycolicibacterium canariasense]